MTAKLPGLQILRRYERAWLPHDLVAGLVLTTMLVPVGIAYAVASGVPGINGLYATIVPLLAYALFGPSRILVLGPDSALAAVILAVVLPLSGGDPERALDAGGAMAIVSGVVCAAVGLSRLGFITELLSKPIRYGYMNGIAVTIILSQFPKLLGFSASADGPLRQMWAIGENSTIAEATSSGTSSTPGARRELCSARMKPSMSAPASIAASTSSGRVSLHTLTIGRESSSRSLSAGAPALSCALSNSSTLRRSSSFPPQAWSRNAARSPGDGFFRASRKMDASSIPRPPAVPSLQETVRRRGRNDPKKMPENYSSASPTIRR